MIRPAAAQDAPGIAAIWNPIIRDTAITFTTEEKSHEAIAALIDERRAAGQGAWVAARAGTVLGFAFYGQFRGGPGYRLSMEHTIHLAPAARGQGLGRGLMEVLSDHAARAGVQSLWAGISAENAGGLAFHRALGFAEIAVLPQVGTKFGRLIDLHLMRRALVPQGAPTDRADSAALAS